VKTVDWPALQAAGLDYCFSEKTPRTPRYVNANGPDGGDGCVVAQENLMPLAKIIYNGPKQIWRKIPNSTTWVGMYPDDKPTPHILERESCIEGEIITMGGAEWLVPIARGLSIEGESLDELRYVCKLPMVAGLDEESGDWTRDQVDAAYALLWNAALEYWDVREHNIKEVMDAKEVGADEPDEDEPQKIVFNYQNQNDSALIALATNYRVSKMEVVLLGLFTDDTTARILEVLVDADTWRRWLKKKIDAVGDGSNTASGENGARTDTGRR